MEEMMHMVDTSSLVTDLISMVVGIVSYILISLSLYTIAKRRGIRKPWLAWIPGGNAWITGSISDHYRHVTRGERKSKRKVLLGLYIAVDAITVVLLVWLVVVLVRTMGLMQYSYVTEEMAIPLLQQLAGIMLMLIPYLAVAIVYSVFYYIALYDIYRSLDPEHCVVYLVLSILFGVTAPFFLFFNRNKDYGMFPRPQPPMGYIPPNSGWQPPQQWQQPPQLPGNGGDQKPPQ